MQAISLQPGVCSNCSREQLERRRRFECPQAKCGQEFCAGCVRIDPKGHGDYFACPHCKKQVILPTPGRDD